MTSFLGMSIQALADRKLRSALTIIMVVIGVGLIIAVEGMSSGTVEYMNSQFSQLGSNLLIVNPGSQDITNYVIEDIETYEGVREVIPFLQNSVQISTALEEKETILMGVELKRLSLAFPSFSVYEGDYVESSDSLGIFLGMDLADPNGDSFATIGDTLKVTFQKFISPNQRPELEKKSFIVRGIANEIGMQGYLPLDDMAFISLRTAESWFDRGDKYDGLYVITAEEGGSLNRKVENLIEDNYEVTVFSPKQIADVVNRVTTGVKEFVDNIALVSLGVAAVGIITTLYTSVLERTKEIGTLQALGYTKRQILALFLNEALMIGVIGASLGVALGFALGWLMNELIGSSSIKPVFELKSIVIAWTMAIILSTLAGLYPAKKAADLDPVVALRKE
ncbi:MAG: ABC transporter permease [Candidatus Hodarchaeales archaeon]